jgi:hypothetical protein
MTRKILFMISKSILKMDYSKIPHIVVMLRASMCWVRSVAHQSKQVCWRAYLTQRLSRSLQMYRKNQDEDKDTQNEGEAKRKMENYGLCS